MNVLIIGDSQAAGPSVKDPTTSAALERANIGPWLEYFLEQRGATVKRVGKPGYSTKKLVGVAKDLGLTDQPWAVVYWLSGGNDTLNREAYREAMNLWGESPVVALSLPPATLIGNKELGKKVFGIKESSYSPAHFFPKTAAAREEKNKAYKQVAQEAAKVGVDVVYKDMRLFALPDAVEQPSGVVFPVQRDGIHVEGITAREIAEQVLTPSTNWAGYLLGGAAVGLLLKRLI